MLHEGRGREGVTNEVRGMSDRDEVKTGRWGGLGRKMPGGDRVYYLSVGEWIGKHTQAHGHTHTQHTDAEQQNASAPCNNLLIHQLHYNRSITVQTCLLLPAATPLPHASLRIQNMMVKFKYCVLGWSIIVFIFHLASTGILRYERYEWKLNHF